MRLADFANTARSQSSYSYPRFFAKLVCRSKDGRRWHWQTLLLIERYCTFYFYALCSKLGLKMPIMFERLWHGQSWPFESPAVVQIYPRPTIGETLNEGVSYKDSMEFFVDACVLYAGLRFGFQSWLCCSGAVAMLTLRADCVDCFCTIEARTTRRKLKSSWSASMERTFFLAVDKSFRMFT